jgi:hypothetical protein
LGQVLPFVFYDDKGLPLTRELLYKGVTLILYTPSPCDAQTCPVAARQVTMISDWVSKNLSIEHAEEKNPLNLLTAGGSSIAPAGWRKMVGAIDPGTLIPLSCSADRSWFVVIDPWLNFAGAWSLDESMDQATLERVLSKTTFEQYLGNYLSRRTFMGPRKDLAK